MFCDEGYDGGAGRRRKRE